MGKPKSRKTDVSPQEIELRRIQNQLRDMQGITRACNAFLRSRGLLQPKGSFAYSPSAFTAHRSLKAAQEAQEALTKADNDNLDSEP